MRYLVTARVKPGKEAELLRAIENGTLGAGSVAGDEYLRCVEEARLCDNGKIKWVEVCFCDVPLDEERPYWEKFFLRTRTPATAAGTRTGKSRGPAAPATARRSSRRSWRARGTASWMRSAPAPPRKCSGRSIGKRRGGGAGVGPGPPGGPGRVFLTPGPFF
jgi:hypothetical protein